MLAVSNEYSQAILADVRDMPYRVTLGGALEMDQSQVPNMTLNESMSGNNGIALGTANAAELSLTLRNPLITNYDGMLVEPESGLVLPDGSVEWVPLGKFWVTKSATSNDYKTVKLTCVDGMYRMSSEYESDLTYPTDIKTFVHEIIAKSGVDFIEPEVWPNVIIRVKPEKMSLRNAIGYAAGCCGCNARFNRYGQLEFVWYKDTGVTIEREAQYMDGMTKLNDKPLEVSFEVTGAKEKYAVTVLAGEHGSAYATPQSNVLEGDTVSIAIRPDSFYQTASISAYTAAGAEVPLSVDADGAGYTFVQPDSNVTVTVAFASEGLRELTVRSNDYGIITHSSGSYDEGYEYFKAGDKVQLYVSPFTDCVVGGFTTIPARIPITYVGITDTDELVYEMTMPDSDATVIANFAEDIRYNIECVIADIDPSSPPGEAVIVNKTNPGEIYRAGDIISLQFVPQDGYEYDYCESNAELLQLGNGVYQFVMPAYDVGIVVYFKPTSGKYSWMQTPVQLSEEYQYWVVEYNGDYYSSCSRDAFHLYQFKDWYVDGFGQVVLQDAAHFLSECTDGGLHFWESAPISIGNEYLWTSASGVRNVIVSNVTFTDKNGTVLFAANESQITGARTSCIVGGMDIREKDIFREMYGGANPDDAGAPAYNWIIIDNHDANIFGERIESELYDEGYYIGSYKPFKGVTRAVVFFNDLSTEVRTLDSSTNGEQDKGWVIGFTNGYYAEVPEDGESWAFTQIPENVVWAGSFTSDLNFHHFVGASTVDIILDSECVFHKNDCKFRDYDPVVSTFSFRSMRALPTTDPVTLSYTNPLIYEKMVPAISGIVQGITYTPAKVKHRGNPAFQAGDIISVPDGDGVYHNVLIMQQTLTFGGGMNSTISCPGQTAATAVFSSSSPQNTQIKNEVDKAYAQLEHEMSINSAAIYSALFKAFGTSAESLQNQANNQAETLIAHDRRITDVEDSAAALDARVTALEGNTELGNLKRQLAETDQQIAYCAEIFMLEIMVNGVSPAEVSLPYDISELHEKRHNLRAQISELEGTE